MEDEASLVRTLTDLLVRRGYQVEARFNGEDGVRFAESNECDLIILDVMLPKMDGFEVCRHLRKSGIRIPILMLTARGETFDKVTGFEGGADDYVTKPYDPDELLARIGALLRRASFTGPNDLPDLRTRRQAHRFRKVPIDPRQEDHRTLRTGVTPASILCRTQR